MQVIWSGRNIGHNAEYTTFRIFVPPVCRGELGSADVVGGSGPMEAMVCLLKANRAAQFPVNIWAIIERGVGGDVCCSRRLPQGSS